MSFTCLICLIGSISCTDQLPARRTILPKLCPECGSDHGSIRMSILTGTRIPTSRRKGRGKEIRRGGDTVILVRIKHYNAAAYSSVKNLMKSKIGSDANNEKLKKELYKKQQKWCSFRIDEYFISQFEPDLMKKYESMERLNDRKSFDWKPNPSFLNAVEKYGWNDIPRYSSKYRRADYRKQSLNSEKLQII